MNDILLHPLLLTIVLAGGGAQAIKFIIYSIKFKTLHPTDLIVTGGMPSSHSAVMVGLLVGIYLHEGATTSFFLTLALTGIVVVNAMGVRRSTGEQGLLLVEVMKKLRIKHKQTHIALGHTPAQVLVGCLWGLAMAIGVHVLL